MTGWAAGWPRGGWAAGPPETSGGWLLVRVWAPPGAPLSARVWLAATADSHTPAEADWQPASWLADGKRVAAQIPGLTPGAVYMAWLRAEAPPQRPVKRAGRFHAGAAPP